MLNLTSYYLLRYFETMNLWQKLILLVLFLACFIEEALAAPKKAVKSAPAPKKAAPKKAPAPTPKGKGKKSKREEEEEE
jgi:hypothetical protein